MGEYVTLPVFVFCLCSCALTMDVYNICSYLKAFPFISMEVHDLKSAILAYETTDLFKTIHLSC